jgi:regulator of protease activity HflC (stomatin/prohibitin superfamily)
VTDPKAYLFNVEDPAETLQQVAESAMREVVGRRPAQDIFRDNRQAIETEVKTIVQGTMDRYGSGVSINAITIEDVAPPREVADAFEEVQRAEQDEDRSSKRRTSMPTRSSVRPAVTRRRSVKRRPPTRTASSRKRRVRRSASSPSMTNMPRRPK